MLKPLLALAVLCTAVALGATACGSSDESGATTTEEASSPAEAIAEIDAIKPMLDDALAKYRAGDKEAADTIVGDAYLEHFEHVEDPLGERDHELMEEIEEKISTDIRAKMKADAPADDVAALVDETKADLDTARTKLQEAA